LEKGGKIVNFAINLNGKKPIQANATVLDKPIIRLHTKDSNQTAEFSVSNLKELFIYNDPCKK